MVKLILSLGSSIGIRYKTLNSAIKDINNNIGKISEISSVYETEPWGFEDINLFLNMAVSVQTDLSPRKILTIIHQIELNHGRKHNKNNTYQSRTLDIDIIFYGNKLYYENDLQIPHILAHKRKFVLMPINDIEPNFVHPLFNKSVNQLLEICTDNSILNKYNIFSQKNQSLKFKKK